MPQADPSLSIHGVEVGWDLASGTVAFGGLRSALFWLDPSLLWMLAPLADELGVSLFRLLIAHNANLGADDDYHRMIAGHEFTAGFRGWAQAVAGAGWGRFELTRFDRRTCEAEVVVHDPWELGMQHMLPVARRWGCPFLQGKLMGLFFRGFGATCWAEEVAAEDGSRVTFSLARSTRTIAHELEVLRAARADEQSRRVAALLAQRTAQLEAARAELELLVTRQARQIQRLSAVQR